MVMILAILLSIVVCIFIVGQIAIASSKYVYTELNSGVEKVMRWTVGIAIFVVVVCALGYVTTSWDFKGSVMLTEITENKYCMIDQETGTYIYKQLGEKETDSPKIVTKRNEGGTQVVLKPIENGEDPYVSEFFRIGKVTVEHMYIIHVPEYEISW